MTDTELFIKVTSDASPVERLRTSITKLKNETKQSAKETKAASDAEKVFGQTIDMSTKKVKVHKSTVEIYNAALTKAIKTKREERIAYINANYQYNESTKRLDKLSLSQKLMIGDWKTGFPTLNKANQIMNSLRWSMVNVGFAIGAIAAIGAPFYLLAKSGAEWELQLKKIQMVTDDVYNSSKKVSELSTFLKETRQGTPFGKFEAGTAFLEFAKAGFSAEEATKALPDILNLATAGFTDLDTATKIVTSTLNAFALQNVTTKQIVDVVAKAANESALDVETFGTAMAYVAPIAANLGFSLEETSAAMALLSNAGLRGSQAGTALRQVMNSITNPSEEAKASMKRLGISFYDAEGNIKSLSKIMANLSVALDDLTSKEKGEVLGELFSIRSRVAATAFLNIIEDGGYAIAEMTSSLETDVGYAAEKAEEAFDTSINNMKDAIENLKDAFEPLATAFNNFLSPIIEKFGDFVGGISSILDKMGPAGNATVAIGGVATAGIAGKAVYEMFKNRGSSVANPLYVYDINGIGKGEMAAVLNKNTIWGGIKKLIPGLAVPAAIVGGSMEAKYLTEQTKTSGSVNGGIDAFFEPGTLWEGLKEAIRGTWLGDLFGLYTPNPTGYESMGVGRDSPKATTTTTASDVAEETQNIAESLRTTYLDEWNKYITGLQESLEPKEVRDIKGMIEQLEILKELKGATDEEKQSIDANISSLQNRINEIYNLNTSLSEYSEKMKNAQDSIDKYSDAIANAKDDLAGYNEKLAETNQQISLLSKPMFQNQTELGRFIDKYELFIKTQELLGEGITDPYEFLVKELEKSKNGFDDLATSVETVQDAVNDSQDDYQAWRETVMEFIRDTVIAGEALGENVTGAVQDYQTLLLATSRFADEQKDSSATDAQSDYLQSLKDAYDLYYGEMMDDVDFAIKQHELEGQTIFSTSEQVIAALQAKWKEQDKWTSSIDSTNSIIDELSKRLESAQNSLKNYKKHIDEITESLREMAKAASQSILGGRSGIPVGNTSPIVGDFEVGEEIGDSGWRRGEDVTFPSAAIGGQINKDGMMYVHAGEVIKPASAVQPYSASMDGGTTNIEININGVSSSDPIALSRMIAQKIKSELKRI